MREKVVQRQRAAHPTLILVAWSLRPRPPTPAKIYAFPQLGSRRQRISRLITLLFLLVFEYLCSRHGSSRVARTKTTPFRDSEVSERQLKKWRRRESYQREEQHGRKLVAVKRAAHQLLQNRRELLRLHLQWLNLNPFQRVSDLDSLYLHSHMPSQQTYHLTSTSRSQKGE